MTLGHVTTKGRLPFEKVLGCAFKLADPILCGQLTSMSLIAVIFGMLINEVEDWLDIGLPSWDVRALDALVSLNPHA